MDTWEEDRKRSWEALGQPGASAVMTCLEKGLRQIPNLQEVRDSIEAGTCLLLGEIVDRDSGYT